MSDYKILTVDENEDRFAGLPNFVKEMADKGIKFVPVVSSGVK